MERKFTNENLEQFLKQSADGLRMLPSDKVWKGISKHFRQRRRRWGLFIGIGLLITTSTSYYLLTQHGTENNATVASPAPSFVIEDVPDIPVQESIANTSGLTDNSIIKQEKSVNQIQPEIPAFNNTVAIFNNESVKTNAEPVQADIINLSANSIAGLFMAAENSLINENTPEGDITQSIVDDTYPITETAPIIKNSSLQERASVPLTIESVINSYQSSKKKLTTQIYFTPTVSYRKLNENKAYIKTVSPGNIPPTQTDLYDVNNFVTHKPDFGFEVGLAAKYPLNQNLNLRAGIQFNVNRYDIKVFNSSTQLATIRLNNRNGIDSVNQVTNYSNTPNGYSPNWLENFYFQVSAPIGVEFKFKQNKNVEFGIASTIQPTYILGDRAYLISTDYKNYAEVPWLIRRWNVNTSLETFVAYSTGRLNWQVGPQVRYQLLSSFVKKYPVKENLFDFGLKVGIGVSKQ